MICVCAFMLFITPFDMQQGHILSELGFCILVLNIRSGVCFVSKLFDSEFPLI